MMEASDGKMGSIHKNIRLVDGVTWSEPKVTMPPGVKEGPADEQR
jgi:hypothetical protein